MRYSVGAGGGGVAGASINIRGRAPRTSGSANARRHRLASSPQHKSLRQSFTVVHQTSHAVAPALLDAVASFNNRDWPLPSQLNVKIPSYHWSTQRYGERAVYRPIGNRNTSQIFRMWIISRPINIPKTQIINCERSQELAAYANFSLWRNVPTVICPLPITVARNNKYQLVNVIMKVVREVPHPGLLGLAKL